MALGWCDIQFRMALTRGWVKVEDAVLFPSQSISGKEVGIEEFNSPKIEREREMLGEEEREEDGKERERGRQRWSVCVFV